MVKEQSPEIYSSDASKVIGVVRKDPGCNITQARQRTGLGRHVFQNALEEAIRIGGVHQIPYGRETLLFPAHDEIYQIAPQLAALRDPENRRLYRFLHSEHEITDRQILVQYAQHEWELEEDCLRWQLRRLEEAGLLQAFHGWQDLRQTKYRCLPPHPYVSRFLR